MFSLFVWNTPVSIKHSTASGPASCRRRWPPGNAVSEWALFHHVPCGIVALSEWASRRRDHAFEITNMFNTYFTNIGNELANKINYSGTKDFTYYLRNRQNQKFTLNEVNEQTVTRIIENLPAKKSCGYDDISNIFLKHITTSIIKPLTVIKY